MMEYVHTCTFSAFCGFVPASVLLCQSYCFTRHITHNYVNSKVRFRHLILLPKSDERFDEMVWSVCMHARTCVRVCACLRVCVPACLCTHSLNLEDCMHCDQ